jgi:hypothetical protein
MRTLTESVVSQNVPGCSQVKTSEVLEADVPRQIVVAMRQEGEFGPSNIEATLAKQVAEAKALLKTCLRRLRSPCL